MQGLHIMILFPLYLDTTHLSIQEAAWKAMVQFGSFRLSSMGKAYEIIVQEGVVDHLGELLHLQNHKGPITIVSDSNVAPLYANRIQKILEGAGYKVVVITIPAGEASKTIPYLEHLWQGFLTAGLDRSSTVIALGGGDGWRPGWFRSCNIHAGYHLGGHSHLPAGNGRFRFGRKNRDRPAVG